MDTRHTVQADALVPAAQGAMIGAGVAAATLGLGAVIAALARLPWWIAPAGAVVAGLVTSGAGAVLLTLDHRRLLWTAERVTRLDLDRDSVIGEPLQERPPVRIELVDRERRRMQFVELPLTDAQLEHIATRTLRPGGVFSRRALEDVLGAETYQLVLARLLGAGLVVARGRSPEAGYDLAPSGRAWLRRYLT